MITALVVKKQIKPSNTEAKILKTNACLEDSIVAKRNHAVEDIEDMVQAVGVLQVLAGGVSAMRCTTASLDTEPC